MVQRENSLKKENFEYCFRPIYYFSRAYGQIPFTITYYKNGAIDGVKIYKRDYIWVAISFVWLSIC